VLSVILLI